MEKAAFKGSPGRPMRAVPWISDFESEDFDQISREIDELYELIVSAYSTNLLDFRNLVQKYIDLLSHFQVFPVTPHLKSTAYIEFLVHILNQSDADALKPLVLQCCFELVSRQGEIESLIMQSNLIEVVIGMLMGSTQHRSLLLSIIAEITGFDKDVHLMQVIERMFHDVSPDTLLRMDVRDMSDMALIVANITQIEPPPDVQIAALNFVCRCYENNFENTYYSNLWTLLQLTGFASFFDSDAWRTFYDARLNLFLDDMMFSDSENCVYASLYAIGNIYMHGQPPVANRHDGILKHVFGENDLLARVGFWALKFVIQRDEGLCRMLQENQKWRDMLTSCGCASFQTKEMICEFVVAFIGCSGETCLRQMMEYGIVEFLSDALDFDSPELANVALRGIKYLLVYFEERGCVGFFEVNARGRINMDKITEITHQKKSDLTRLAAILQSLLLKHCPELMQTCH